MVKMPEEEAETPQESTETDIFDDLVSGKGESSDSGEEAVEEQPKKKRARKPRAAKAGKKAKVAIAEDSEDEPMDMGAENEDGAGKKPRKKDSRAEKMAEEDDDEDHSSGDEDLADVGEEEPEVEEELLKESDVKEEGISEEELDEDTIEGDESESETKPGREEIKQIIMKKAQMAGAIDKSAEATIKLRFLEDEKGKQVFIGRKKSVYKQYGTEAALFLGRVNEEEYKDKNILLDGLNPHVVFVCGARGSGKSYVLGVIAEELALKNKNVGVVVIDPIGVFWSMRFPNKEERELDRIKEWGMKPQGLSNLKVFIPSGMTTQVPKSTYDKGFSMQPALLTSEDWCLTFHIDRFSVTGLLLEKVLKKVEKGYTKVAEEDKKAEKILSKGRAYSLDDIIHCLEKDDEINSREKGYKQDSIRALVSRFEAAKAWGIFDEKGTPLSELSREGQLTILDTSFLDDTVTALVIGVLARRLLAARKISTRKEAAHKFKSLDVDDILELEVPPTWLFIDEAHTLIPSGNEKTPASSALVEYVKQGRRPGCSLVFATQQPSAIDTKVLSQLDVIIAHKLIFDDDIKAIYKRTPTIIPGKYKRSSFIKTLPVGVALSGDRSEETSRAFIMAIRPRLSQHEGRDAETVSLKEKLDPEKVKELIVEVLYRDLLKERELDLDKVENVIETLNAKYKSNIGVDDILAALKVRGVVATAKSILLDNADTQDSMLDQLALQEGEETLEAVKQEAGTVVAGTEAIGKATEMPAKIRDKLRQESTELRSLPVRVSQNDAARIADAVRKKRVFGIIGDEEKIKDARLKYYTLWKVGYDVVSGRGEFLSRECFIDSVSGEFVHFVKDRFVESNGLKWYFGLNEEEINVFRLLSGAEASIDEIMGKTQFTEGKVVRILKKFADSKMIGATVEGKTGKKFYWLKEKIDLPPHERHELLESLSRVPFVKAEALAMERPTFNREQVPEILRKLWKNVVVKRIDEVYKPVWEVMLESGSNQRIVVVDAVIGKII
jgi:hypothetical protein